jgi:hypothetical protein
METEGWKVLVKEHPPLLEQVFKALATQVFVLFFRTFIF